jgi:2-polyprenyl-3-methyl-5-hydroxy-6-metoxy-1,4-benzoquinol methylase
MRSRVLQPELMDDPNLAPEPLAHALSGLRRLNATSGAHTAIWRQLRPVLQASSSATLIDVACASGDLAIDLHLRAAADNIPLRVTGCDINTASLALARQQATDKHASSITFLPLDALASPPLPQADIVTASLFLHHLSTPDAITVLRKLRAAAGKLVLVNDLVRSRFNFAMVTLASRVLTRSPIVHTDAVLSVRAAFTKAELLDLARRAGWQRPQLTFGGLGRVNLMESIPPKP